MLGNGAIIGDVDVAQLLVAAFVIFFLVLVLHLRREDKREGYPLVDPAGGGDGEGFPTMPKPKLFHRPDGSTWSAPHPETERPLAAQRAFPFPGSSLDPTGDPLIEGVGPAAWALRREEPMAFSTGKTQMTPMRIATGWVVAKGDVDPRGLPVIDAWGERAGVVRDLWIDRGVNILRYLEVDLDGGVEDAGPVLLPIHHTDIRRRQARVALRGGVRAAHLARAPTLASPDVVTAREEDRINGFYAGAAFYEREGKRRPARLAPWETRPPVRRPDAPAEEGAPP